MRAPLPPPTQAVWEWSVPALSTEAVLRAHEQSDNQLATYVTYMRDLLKIRFHREQPRSSFLSFQLHRATNIILTHLLSIKWHSSMLRSVYLLYVAIGCC